MRSGLPVFRGRDKDGVGGMAASALIAGWPPVWGSLVRTAWRAGGRLEHCGPRRRKSAGNRSRVKARTGGQIASIGVRASVIGQCRTTRASSRDAWDQGTRRACPSRVGPARSPASRPLDQRGGV